MKSPASIIFHWIFPRVEVQCPPSVHPSAISVLNSAQLFFAFVTDVVLYFGGRPGTGDRPLQGNRSGYARGCRVDLLCVHLLLVAGRDEGRRYCGYLPGESTRQGDNPCNFCALGAMSFQVMCFFELFFFAYLQRVAFRWYFLAGFTKVKWCKMQHLFRFQK